MEEERLLLRLLRKETKPSTIDELTRNTEVDRDNEVNRSRSLFFGVHLVFSDLLLVTLLVSERSVSHTSRQETRGRRRRSAKKRKEAYDFGSDLLVILLESSEILTSLGKLSFLHSLQAE